MAGYPIRPNEHAAQPFFFRVRHETFLLLWEGALRDDDTKRHAAHDSLLFTTDVISLFPDLRLPSRDLMNFFPVLGGAYPLLSVLTVCQIESKR